eukprot:GFUD01028924.1.p1 GENE.GFUD01028924.1~~GFUD01028924.1.p1  ORF type:complete len:241 (-),score=53.50 GFUD01028924.1:131-853(-)
MSGGGEVKKGSPQLSPKMENKVQDDAKIHELIHYQQKYNWDCGLSCCLMVLNHSDRNFILNNLNCFVEEEGFGESTWTIDLCYILNRFKVNFKYTTITLGVDPGYIKENFYDKVLAKDSGRVNTRFEEAESRGMNILESAVTMEEILDHLDKIGPVIVLTNANLLTCTRCSNYISCYPSCFTSISYQGHYVVLVGFNPTSKEVLYRNPTVKDKVCHMPYDSLEESRTAYGTDEDVIFIYP